MICNCIILFIFLKNDIFDFSFVNISLIIVSEFSVIYFEIAFICSLLKGNLKLSRKNRNNDLLKLAIIKFLIFICKILLYGFFLYSSIIELIFLLNSLADNFLFKFLKTLLI